MADVHSCDWNFVYCPLSKAKMPQCFGRCVFDYLQAKHGMGQPALVELLERDSQSTFWCPWAHMNKFSLSPIPDRIWGQIQPPEQWFLTQDNAQCQKFKSWLRNTRQNRKSLTAMLVSWTCHYYRTDINQCIILPPSYAAIINSYSRLCPSRFCFRVTSPVFLQTLNSSPWPLISS